MRVTGLSEFLIYGLLFVAIVGFNLFKQVLTARREQQRRRERAMQHEQPAMEPIASAPVPVPVPIPVDSQWGRVPEPAPVVFDVPAEPAMPNEVVVAREREQDRLARKREELAARKRSLQQVVALHDASPRRILRTRNELRHGIVLMTVLGPCRALRPYDQETG